MWVKFSEISGPERDALPDSQFAFIDKDGNRHLPIHDANHVRNALSRVNQTKGLTGAAKKTALAKIKRAAAKYGIDTSKKAMSEYVRLSESSPHFGPGGDLNWDDKEEPDESEDDTRPGDKKAHDKDPDDDGDDDTGEDEEDEEGESSQADEGAPSPGMDAGDVHVPAPVNSERSKRSKTLRNLTRAVRAHLASGRLLASDQFEKIYRQSIGSQGGSAKKRLSENGVEQLDVHCCDNSCGQCQGAGCGCCDDCFVSVEGSEDAVGEKTRYGSPQEGEDDDDEPQAYTEGSPHFVGKDGTAMRMFIPIKATEKAVAAGQWIEYLPAPGVWDSPRYGKIEITAQRNQNFVKNFNDGVYQDRIPIDAEHETKIGGAFGWISQGGMRLRSNGAVEAWAEWNARGQKVLSEQRFCYFSPEWYDSWKDPATGKRFDDVAIGGALTTKPFFKPSSLQPVIASEQGFMAVKVEPKAEEEKPKMAGETNETPESKRLTELETQKTELETQLSEARQAAETANKARDAEVAASKKMAERLDAIEADTRRREFREQALGEFTGDVEKHVSMMERLHEDPEALADYVSIQKSAAEQLKTAGVFTAIGSSTAQANGESSAAEEVRKAAELAVKDSGGKVSQARAAAEAWTPEAYEKYMRETGQAAGRSRN